MIHHQDLNASVKPGWSKPTIRSCRADPSTAPRVVTASSCQRPSRGMVRKRMINDKTASATAISASARIAYERRSWTTAVVC